MSLYFRFTVLAALFLVPLLAAPAFAAEEELPLRLIANAADPDGGGTTLLDITITGWTPEAERQDLLRVLRADGGRALRDSLQDGDSKGRIAPRAELGIELRYAYRVTKAGGSTIVLAADRPIDVGEAIGQDLVSRAYDTTVVVLELDETGRGTGQLMFAAEAGFDEDGELRFTNVVPNPVRLGNVRLATGR